MNELDLFNGGKVVQIIETLPPHQMHNHKSVFSPCLHTLERGHSMKWKLINLTTFSEAF